MKNSKKNKYLLSLSIISLIVMFVLDILLGSVSIPFSEFINVLTGGNSASTYNTIIIDFRIPKAITALLAGSGLAVCGLLMQTYFRNPLAGPFVLGISSGASLGVAIVVLTSGTAFFFNFNSSVGRVSTTLAAGIGAGAILFFIAIISKKIKSNVTLLIIGLMFGHLIGSAESILKYFSTAENLQGFIIWGLGNFSNVVWSDLAIMAPLIISALVLSYFLSKQLNLLLLGENYAISMGANIKLIRPLIIITGGILGGVITAFCGPIAFLGIAVPHLTKSLFNEYDHKSLIPAVAIVGGILSLLCDLISQMPGNDQVLPINAVTSLIGAPIVIWIIVQQKKLKLSNND